eukprot:1265280-Pyramimonas_sp.AAC.1
MSMFQSGRGCLYVLESTVRLRNIRAAMISANAALQANRKSTMYFSSASESKHVNITRPKSTRSLQCNCVVQQIRHIWARSWKVLWDKSGRPRILTDHACKGSPVTKGAASGRQSSQRQFVRWGNSMGACQSYVNGAIGCSMLRH